MLHHTCLYVPVMLPDLLTASSLWVLRSVWTCVCVCVLLSIGLSTRSQRWRPEQKQLKRRTKTPLHPSRLMRVCYGAAELMNHVTPGELQPPFTIYSVDLFIGWVNLWFPVCWFGLNPYIRVSSVVTDYLTVAVHGALPPAWWSYHQH